MWKLEKSRFGDSLPTRANEATIPDGNQRVMQYSEGSTSPNILGGSSANTIASNLTGAAILSGGSKLAPNNITDTFSVITGGAGNVIDSAASYSNIGGGRANNIQGPYSVISGGDSNKITAPQADHNFIGGGLDNIENNPSFGAIGGGWHNVLDVNAWGSFIGAGAYDSIQAQIGTIGGGRYNKILTNSSYCVTIAGGQGNQISNGTYSFIGAGGFVRIAGLLLFIALRNQQQMRWDVKGFGNSTKISNRNIFFRTFNLPNIGAMKSGQLCKFFLR